MKKIVVKTKTVRLLSDTITPVSIYLKIRDIYPNSLLLESSDYHVMKTVFHISALNRLLL
jgi:anthranilate synthase component 1